MLPTLEALRQALASGAITSRALVQSCLERISDPAGEGARTYVLVDAQTALNAADAVDRARVAGQRCPPYAGIPVSVKDLFDIQGQTTKAGSKVLGTAPPAQRDADAVAALRSAGFIILGRTNMTEFAYSGLGLNPHYGTPLNPYDRATGRIPGGSSSGAATSVAYGMAAAALGTDTGGSCRIPAALTGLAGFKPSANRVSRKGAFPLSNALDSVGPIARTAACCATLDAVLSGENISTRVFPINSLRVGVPQTLVLEDMDAEVAASFQAALSLLAQAGARIYELPFAEFAELPGINAKGGYTAVESYCTHKQWLTEQGDLYDPRIKVRIEQGAGQTEADLRRLDAQRADWIYRVTRHFAVLDVIACPTVPIIAPALAELADDEAYGRINLLMLRNPALINFMDGCSISLPCHEPGKAPTGLMLSAPNGHDHTLLAAARSVELLLNARWS